MEDQIISIDTAKLAKEKGLNIKVGCYYIGSNNALVKAQSLENFNSWFDTDNVKFISAPTQSLLQKWIRENHEIRIVIEEDYDKMLGYLRGYIPRVNGFDYYNGSADCFEKYEDALEKTLVVALNLIEC